MRKRRQSKRSANILQVEVVPLSEQQLRRRGKHHDLTRHVLKQLECLGVGSAVKIELRGIPAKTLRSAVFRATSAQGIQISSFSDPYHLYIFKKKPPPRDQARSSDS
jgi:hypothetical protein